MHETYTTVVGNLISAANTRHLADGTSVVNFRVASNERRRDRATGEWTDGDRLYVSVTCWRRLAENVGASFVAGDPIIVHGRMYTRDYEKNGARYWVTEMEGLAVGPDLTRCTASVIRAKRGAFAGAEEPTGSPHALDGAREAAAGVVVGNVAEGAAGSTTRDLAEVGVNA